MSLHGVAPPRAREPYRQMPSMLGNFRASRSAITSAARRVGFSRRERPPARGSVTRVGMDSASIAG